MDPPPELPPPDLMWHYEPPTDPNSPFDWHHPEIVAPQEHEHNYIDLTQFYDPWENFRGKIPSTEFKYEQQEKSDYSFRVERIEISQELRNSIWEYKSPHYDNTPNQYLPNTHQSQIDDTFTSIIKVEHFTEHIPKIDPGENNSYLHHNNNNFDCIKNHEENVHTVQIKDHEIIEHKDRNNYTNHSLNNLSQSHSQVLNLNQDVTITEVAHDDNNNGIIDIKLNELTNGYYDNENVLQYEDKVKPRHPYDDFYLKHRSTIDARGRKICTHELPPTPPTSPPLEIIPNTENHLDFSQVSDWTQTVTRLSELVRIPLFKFVNFKQIYDIFVYLY